MSGSWIEHSFKASYSKTSDKSKSPSSSSSSRNNLSPFLSPSSSRFHSKSRLKPLTGLNQTLNGSESTRLKAVKRPITFDDDIEEEEDDDFRISIKSKINNTKSKKISFSSFEPKSAADLAISKQKLQELRNWFIDRFSPSSTKQSNPSSTTTTSKSPFLLLNGPAGSGKTIAVKVLSKEYRVEAVELPATGVFNEQDLIADNLRELSIRNSVHQDEYEDRDFSSKIKSLNSENQLNRFQRFLYDLNRFRRTVLDDSSYDGEDSSDSNGNKPTRITRKLLLIEDIPQIFFIKPELLHDELRLLHSRFKSRTIPIVFIISDTVNGASVEQKVLPKTIQTKLNFEVITFKPITITCINKVLSRTSIGKNLSKSEIEDISLSSCGDIRTALNCLLFNYSNNKSVTNNKFIASNATKKLKLSIDSKSKSKKQSNQKNRAKPSFNDFGDESSNDSTEANFNGRNEPLTMVHAMGKILYAKRTESVVTGDSDFFRKFPHINKDLQRNPLNERRPEEIAERANVRCDSVADWLYENYCDFIQDEGQLDYSIDCLQVLSDVDSLFRDFETKDIIENLRTSYLIRGSMFSLNRDSSSYRPVINLTMDRRANSSGHSFHPIRAPKHFQLNRESSDNQLKLSEFKQSCFYRSSLVELNSNLVLDILPIVEHVPELQKQLRLQGLHCHVESLCNFGGNSGSGSNNNNNRYWNKNHTNWNMTINHQQQQTTSTNNFQNHHHTGTTTTEVDSSMRLTMSGYDEIDSDSIDIEDDSD